MANKGKGGKGNSETHVQGVMEYITGVLFLGAPLTVPDDVEPSADPNYFGRGSWNFKLLYCVVWWVYWALLIGPGNSTVQLKIARTRLLNFFRYAAQCHSGSEPFSASHGQLHWGGHMAVLYLANKLNDMELAEYPLRWARFEYMVYRVARFINADGLPDAWLPGGRGFFHPNQPDEKILGTNEGREEVMVAIEQGRQVAKVKSQYDLGATCIVQLPAAVRDEIKVPLPESELPTTWAPLIARRFEDDDTGPRFYAWFNGTRWKDATMAAGRLEDLWVSKVVAPPFDAIGYPPEDTQAVLSITTRQSPLRAIEEERAARPKPKPPKPAKPK